MEQPMGQTIPATLEQCTTGQLGGFPSHCPVCPQLMAKRDNEKLTIQASNGKQAKDDMGGEKDKGANGRQMPSRHKGGM